jgi:hypothetical protein
MLALFKYVICQCLGMALEQEIRFVLNLNLAESYIYGTASIHDKSYSINIQQATQQSIVLPTDFFYIQPSSQALVYFGGSMDNNNKIIITSEIKVGQGDFIEVYLNQDNILLALANQLPMKMILQTNSVSNVNN